MDTSVFLMAGIACVVVVLVVKHSPNLKSSKNKHHLATHYLPKAISMLIITAQISELVKVVEHVSIVNVSAALLLLTILAANKSGTEGNLH